MRFCSSAAKTLRVAFPIAETGFDPGQINDLYSSTVNANIFEAPLTYDFLARPSKIVPNTATAMPEISADGKTLYHAGDTALFLDMQLIGRVGIDVALLPIGDNYTMGPDDALRAVRLLQPRQVTPIHYNTWDLLAQDAEGLPAVLLEVAHHGLVEPGVALAAVLRGELLEAGEVVLRDEVDDPGHRIRAIGRDRRAGRVPERPGGLGDQRDRLRLRVAVARQRHAAGGRLALRRLPVH